MAKRKVKQTKKSNSNTQHTPTGMYLVAIAAIIAMVAMVTFFTDTDTTSIGLSEEDLSGQAIQPVTEPCAESDGGNNQYTKGYSTGTYPWGFAVTGGGVPDKCRLNNNQPTASCTNCKLMEYYCVDDPNDPRFGHLFWEFYTGVDCVNGAAAQPQQSCSIAVATTYELDDYPDMFNGTNSTFNGSIVVGDTAPAWDVIGITEISMGLQSDGITVGQIARLDTEISNVCDQNIVTVGDVCENTVIQDILGYDAGDCNDAYADLGLDSDEAYIGLFESNTGEIYLVVTGEDSEIRHEAAEVVADHNHPDFNNQYMIYQSVDLCQDKIDELETIQDELDDLLDELGDRIDDLNAETTQFTVDLNAVLTTFDGAHNDISAVQNFIFAEDYEDATDFLEDMVDDMEDALNDLETIIDDIDDEGYDEEPFEDLHDDFEDAMEDLDDIKGFLAANCP